MNLCVLGAGRADRFHGAFKPFMPLADLTFLEACLEPYRHHELRFYLVATRQQEEAYDVSSRAQALWPGIQCVVIPSATDGPLASAAAAIQIEPLLQHRTIFTDCDHALQPGPLLARIALGAPRVAGVWQLQEGQEWYRFDKMLQDGDRLRLLDRNAPYTAAAKGILGCYFFEDASVLKQATSADFPALLEELSWELVEISSGAFFGEPAAVREYLAARREHHTAFVDIDGVVLQQLPNASVRAADNRPIDCTLRTLRQFRAQGHRVVLVTARSSLRREAVLGLLSELDVPFDDILFDCNSGQRFLLNDMKPALPWRPQAVAVNLLRDEGIRAMPVDRAAVLEFTGYSAARTSLMKGQDGIQFVRKMAPRGPPAQVLRRQAEELRRLNFYSAAVAPSVLDEGENNLVYWYDMVFLADMRPLSGFPQAQQLTVAAAVARWLQAHVYIFRGPAPANFMTDFMTNKIYSKLSAAAEIPELELCATEIQQLLDQHALSDLAPVELHPVHGDLTLENILCNQDGEWKLIDPAGSQYMDTHFTDLGKLFQSFVCGYHLWADGAVAEKEVVAATWPEQVLAEFPATLRQALFYTAITLIRMSLLQHQRVPARGVLSLRLASKALRAALTDISLATPRACLL